MSLDKIHNCNIVLLGGLYGSGKTTFALKHFTNRKRYRVSRLEIRKLIFEMTNFGNKWSGDKFSEEDDVLVKHVERKIIEHYLHNKRNVLVINTFTSIESRTRFTNIAKDMGKSIGIVFLDVPLDTCIKNNASRPSEVPDYILQNLSNKKVVPTRKEAFNEIVVLTDTNAV